MTNIAIARPGLVALLLAAFASADMAFAFERGEPNSDTRKAYCRERYVQCLSKGFDECAEDHSEPQGYNACTSGVDVACSVSLESCKTSERVRGGVAPKQLAPGTGRVTK